MANKRDIGLSLSHLPGVKNNIAALKSRYFYYNKEWPFNPYIFEQVWKKFGKPEVDLFTAGLNVSCESCGSFKPDPNAFAVGVFTQN